MPNSLHFQLTRRVEGWISRRATGAGFNWATEVYLAQSLRELRPATFSPITEHQLYHAAFRVLLASHRNPTIFMTSPAPDIRAANNELTIQTSTNFHSA